ncbi:MAG: hypothetical protein SOT84_12155 [Bariatricus sp.]|nr:hypothetical protein [Bariatricus sp.]
MAKKNNGRDFLFSDDCGFINGDDEGGESYRYSDGSGYYRGADGSEGYIYSDGSGYYHGADGSDGYIYSDGSAYFRGADGTDAYKYSDGSGYYRGGDGSDGYKNSDGSGYFTDSLGSRTSYDADDDDDEDDDDSGGSSLGDALGTIIGAGLAGVMAVGAKAAAEEREREAQREAERREQARINSENRRAWRKRHRKGIAITILISVIVVLSLIGYYEIQKLIPMGYSSDSLEGLKYTEAVQKLKESGFSNVHTKEISDLTISRDDEENLVTEVKLMFGDSFDEDTKYPSNLWITVVYHTVELYAPPLTSKEAKGMNYLDVIDEFENAGFVNVTTVVEYDIVTGWLTDDGEVKSVTINGDKKFDSYNEYRLDAEVVVTYHTLKKNKPK